MAISNVARRLFRRPMALLPALSALKWSLESIDGQCQLVSTEVLHVLCNWAQWWPSRNFPLPAGITVQLCSHASKRDCAMGLACPRCSIQRMDGVLKAVVMH